MPAFDVHFDEETTEALRRQIGETLDAHRPDKISSYEYAVLYTRLMVEIEEKLFQIRDKTPELQGPRLMVEIEEKLFQIRDKTPELQGPRIKYEPGDIIILRGKTQKGKNRVREQGERFYVREVDYSVLSPNLGLLVCPEADKDNTYDPRSRWVRTVGTGDPDFEIVGPGLRDRRQSRVIEVYTDGGVRPTNPGPGAWAYALIKDGELWGEDHEFVPWTTNNQMEMTALIMALYRLEPLAGREIRIIADSQYVVGGCTEWLEGWKRRGWRTSSLEPVKNVELWQELDQLLKIHDGTLEFVHIRGHGKREQDAIYHQWNDHVDERCTSVILAGGTASEGP